MMIDIENIKQGDTFYECQYGINEEFVTTIDPYRENEGWNIKGRHYETDETISFFSRDNYGAYAP